MNFHEYQAKALFADYAIPVPAGRIATTIDQAAEAARAIGGEQWVVKAQIHAGGRGKAGGVKLVRDIDGVKEAAGKMLGSKMVTYQSAGRGLPVDTVLISEANDIDQELYLSCLVDRATKAVSFIVSASGGVDIEQVAKDNPEAIHTVIVDYVQGLQPYQCRKVGFAMGLSMKQVGQLTKIMTGVYKLFMEKDMALIELNPLAIVASGDLMALDGKLNSDDNAEFRHPKLAAMRDIHQEDPAEAEAVNHHLNYVQMDGNIGCMVNGAGLAMATMDVIKLHGGEPANFLDVGGGATKERVTEAFKLILSDRQGQGDPRQHLRRHRPLRHDRRRHHRRGQGSRRDHPGGRAPRRHQCREGPRTAGRLGLQDHPATDLNDAAQKAVAAVKA
jgi:succinyl-CoA synthetase beta subunit